MFPSHLPIVTPRLGVSFGARLDWFIERLDNSYQRQKGIHHIDRKEWFLLGVGSGRENMRKYPPPLLILTSPCIPDVLAGHVHNLDGWGDGTGCDEIFISCFTIDWCIFINEYDEYRKRIQSLLTYKVQWSYE